ncbi:F-gM [Chelonid alphaherpesvirus 5]|uniref:F-gM n=1 Tax=Chelonid alphaherpesvirus 5 TaxID=702736 RepID=V5NWV6_9ALPH|nr:F-gM [Chelonid alphaherpesvirus 5]AHA93330.1 F-gM [Chelonid alphaherpesvirus 5]
MATLSRTDRIHWRLWAVQIVVALLAMILLIISATAAAFPGLGYPCYFAVLVDYGAFDPGRYGAFSPVLTPVLFLEKPEMAFYVYLTLILLMAFGVYLVAGVVILYRMTHSVAELYQGVKRYARMVASGQLVFIITMMVWCFEVFVELISFKLVSLAAGFHTVYFALFCVYLVSGTTRMTSPKTYKVEDLVAKESYRSFYHLVLYGKGVAANCMYAAFMLALLMQCLLIEMVIANSFRLMVADAILIALGLFAVLAFIVLLIGEVALSRYVPGCVGLGLGALLACVLIGVPTLRYADKFKYTVSGGQRSLNSAISGILGFVAVLALVMLIVRLARYFTDAKKENRFTYRLLDQIRSRMKNQMQARRRLLDHEHTTPIDSLPMNGYLPSVEDSASYFDVDDFEDSLEDEEHIYERVPPSSPNY